MLSALCLAALCCQVSAVAPTALDGTAGSLLQTKQTTGKKFLGAIGKAIGGAVKKVGNWLFGKKKAPPPKPTGPKMNQAELEGELNALMNRHEVDELELNQDFSKQQLALENEFHRKYVKINADLAELRGEPPMSDMPSMTPGADVVKMHPMFGSYMGPAALPAFPAASRTSEQAH